MSRQTLIAALILLTACDGKPDPAQKARDDARDIAMVEAAQSQHPPSQSIELEPIGVSDVASYRIHAANCAVRTEQGLDPVVMLDGHRAYLKLTGAMQTLAGDPGSAKLTLDYPARYSGKRFVLDIASAEGAGERIGDDIVRRQATVTIRDPWDQIIYKRDGALECGA